METLEAEKQAASKASWTGSLYYLSLFIAAGSYMPFLYVHFSDQGLNGREIGLIATLGPICMMLLSVPVAALADRFRIRVRVVQIANIGSALGIFLLQFPKDFTGIILLMVLLSIFNASGSSVAESLAARMAQRHKLNYGTMRLWGSFGYAVSSLAFGVIWQAFGFNYLFLVASLLFIPQIFFTNRMEEGVSADSKKSQSVFVLLKDRGLLLLTLATFLSGISNSMAMTFSGIYARALGGGNFVVGLMIASAAFMELPAMFYNERLAKILNPVNTIVLSYALMAAGYLGYIFAPGAYFIPVFSTLKGIGYGFWITLTIRTVTHRTPAHWGATAQSLVTVSIFGLAPLVANPIGGWVNDTFGTRAVFIVGIVALAIGAAVLLSASKLLLDPEVEKKSDYTKAQLT